MGRVLFHNGIIFTCNMDWKWVHYHKSKLNFLDAWWKTCMFWRNISDVIYHIHHHCYVYVAAGQKWRMVYHRLPGEWRVNTWGKWSLASMRYWFAKCCALPFWQTTLQCVNWMNRDKSYAVKDETNCTSNWRPFSNISRNFIWLISPTLIFHVCPLVYKWPPFLGPVLLNDFHVEVHVN